MTDNLELQMDAYLPLRDVVFQTLRGAILKGDLKPGERLMELQLASKLGVSRTPIREAIRMLEQEGLAVTIPRKGAEVAKMTEKDMEDVLQMMIVLSIRDLPVLGSSSSGNSFRISTTSPARSPQAATITISASPFLASIC